MWKYLEVIVKPVATTCLGALFVVFLAAIGFLALIAFAGLVILVQQGYIFWMVLSILISYIVGKLFLELNKNE